MHVDSDNYKQLTVFALVLIAISTFIAYLLYAVFGDQFAKLPVIVQIVISIPTVPAIYAALFFLFDRVLWKWRIFRYLGIVVADDLSGRWEGVINSSWDAFKSDISAELRIKQNATTIKIYGKFNQSRSVSVHEHFGRSDMHDETALYYFYKNDPNYDAPPTMAMHEGSTILTHNKDGGTLSGHYYSGRDRNNYGTISVKRV